MLSQIAKDVSYRELARALEGAMFFINYFFLIYI